MKELAAWFVNTLVGVGAEEITLGLQKIGRQAFGAVTVKERERSGKGRSRDTEADGVNDAATPGRLAGSPARPGSAAAR